MKADVAVFFLTDALELPPSLKNLDQNSQIISAIQADRGFEKKDSHHISSIFAPSGFAQKCIVIVNLGIGAQLTAGKIRTVGGKLAATLNALKAKEVDICIETKNKLALAQDELAINLLIGIKLRNYTFNKHFVAKKAEHTLHLEKVNILINSPDDVKEAFCAQDSIIEGTLFTRQLVAEPANYLYPESFAARCKELSALGVGVTVLEPAKLKELGMGALLAVGQGSDLESRVVVMEWKGNQSNPKDAPIAFVGKGVTFDTGGINLKPSNGIADMKYDMGGAGVVTGLIKAIALRKANVNVIGVIGLVENMPSGKAQRPSDVVVSMSGQTIEVDNTDAEGRLVLADAMWYVQKMHKPKMLIDLATLTGAVSVALGDGYAGLFSNSDKLSEQLTKAGNKVGEELWRLPMGEHYDKQIDSEIADIKNVGQAHRGGGSITAAQFLKRFIEDGLDWAHLDIAGMTWTKIGTDVCPKGATGFGVRLLNQFLQDNCEK